MASEASAGPGAPAGPRTEAAATTGFADQAHLTRHFKRVVGVPPGAFQRARGAVRQ
jgi:AraC-like DNA-binding protein